MIHPGNVSVFRSLVQSSGTCYKPGEVRLPALLSQSKLSVFLILRRVCLVMRGELSSAFVGIASINRDSGLIWGRTQPSPPASAPATDGTLSQRPVRCGAARCSGSPAEEGRRPLLHERPHPLLRVVGRDDAGERRLFDRQPIVDGSVHAAMHGRERRGER